MADLDTVAAIATPPGRGAVALVRISGNRAIPIAERIFSGSRPVPSLAPRTAAFGTLLDPTGSPVDSVLLTVFRAPGSFTGEDLVEISCHGGVLLTQRVLELVFEAGALPAGPGEFTRRAFLNGKMDLTQAEAIMDLIGAQSDRALRAAHEQLEGRLGRETTELRAELLSVLAHLEAYIDFPEEDIRPDTGLLLQARLDAVHARIEALLGSARQGRLLREGVRTVISGPPNAGKSSLLNRLLGFERSIVSAIPGTTRDTLEESVLLGGWALRLIDTAGLRDSEDILEKEGILRAHSQREKADLILQVEDASLPPDPSSLPPSGEALVLTVLNKVDLGEHPSRRGQNAVRISCSDGTGIGELQIAIDRLLENGHGAALSETPASFAAINARHQDCLRRARTFVHASREAFAKKLSPEFISEEIRAALDAVGEIVGRVDTEDLLGEIFSTFCIGK
jgi:tRNA modification GTPase